MRWPIPSHLPETLKKELPFILKTAPQMPRLVHQFLSQQTQAEQNAPLRASIDRLVSAQQNQAKWQKRLTWAILIIAIVQVSLMLIMLLG